MRTFSNAQYEGQLLSRGGYRKRTTGEGRVREGGCIKVSEVDSDFDGRIGYEPSTDSGKMEEDSEQTDENNKEKW